MVIYVVLGALFVTPFLTMGLLGVIGWVSPEVRRKGLRQLARPFALGRTSTSRYELCRGRSDLEDEVIRRFGVPDPTRAPSLGLPDTSTKNAATPPSPEPF
ncbi:MAG: hypothetical protein HIU57_08810 [Acidobacteria bacterium]|nr:hypothetical protein [Acidobacteriota bacterium]